MDTTDDLLVELSEGRVKPELRAQFREKGIKLSKTAVSSIIAAGQDELVSTPAIGQFAVRLRAGSHLVVAGARHELLVEQDRYRSQFWAAFDAFVPGSPVFG